MIRDLQTQLLALGFDPGPIDGDAGPLTAKALTAFLAHWKLPIVATASRGAFSIGLAPLNAPKLEGDLPWMAIARRHLGLSETADNAALRAFLKSDGSTLGDPAQLPWCGDFIETCIKLGLPGEIFTGLVRENPYWAKNWILFGKPVSLGFGAVCVFDRKPSGGHVAFAVGQDETRLFCLGGNQNNEICIVPVAKDRLLGCRAPSTWTGSLPPLPRMTTSQASSLNEA